MCIRMYVCIYIYGQVDGRHVLYVIRIHRHIYIYMHVCVYVCSLSLSLCLSPVLRCICMNTRTLACLCTGWRREPAAATCLPYALPAHVSHGGSTGVKDPQAPYRKLPDALYCYWSWHYHHDDHSYFDIYIYIHHHHRLCDFDCCQDDWSVDSYVKERCQYYRKCLGQEPTS